MVLPLWQDAIHPRSLHADSKSTLQLKQVSPLIFRNQRRGNSVPSSSPGAPNTVDKIFCNVRQIIIEDVSDILYVDPTGSQIRRH
jgi:hypothetical protein